jgi:YVTN family beta-propeller protein
MGYGKFLPSGERFTASRRSPAALGLAALATIWIAASAGGAVIARVAVGPRPDGTGVTSIGQRVTPVGRVSPLELGTYYADKPFGLALSPDGRKLAISNDGLNQSLMIVDTKTGRVDQVLPYVSPEALYLGLVYSPDGRTLFASAGGNNKIRVYDVTPSGSVIEGTPIVMPATPIRKVIGDRGPYPAGLAISSDARRLYVADELADSVSIIDLASRTVVATVGTGPQPDAVTLSADGTRAYATNWGGNTVSVLDALTGAKVKDIEVGMHPNALALNASRAELYVANGDSDSISIVETGTNTVVATVSVSPYPGAPVGSSPNALAVSPDGRRLYVANAGNNAVDIVDLAERKVIAMLPTAWYPTALALSSDGVKLYVASAKGLGAGPNIGEGTSESGQPRRYIGAIMRGLLSTITVPKGASALRKFSRAVSANNDFSHRATVRGTSQGKGGPIPTRLGAPSPIKHVIYVIKENRTYDQVLGSLGRGNGDPKLNLFGEDSAPNQRSLARRFVTLDNYYAAGEVSADGWSWSTQAVANTYDQKNWPAHYSSRQRGFEFQGGSPAIHANFNPDASYVWDSLARSGLSFRNYGFHTTNTAPVRVDSTEPRLQAATDLGYPGFNPRINDQIRIGEWLREFNAYVASGTLPAVEFVSLPSDHTVGTAPGFPTPKAMVADNDLALGRLVDAVSHSSYWASTAIFVTEDDAQDGPDHVDGHRTVGQVISPYTQRGRVDSTLYSTVSMLRTIELIFGLPPLTQFDAAATPMFAAFGSKPNLLPYDAITPAQSLTELNTVRSPMSRESARLDFSAVDAASEDVLNEAIWESLRGAGTYPRPDRVPKRRANSHSG